MTTPHVRLRIHVKPRARHSRILLVVGSSLEVSLAAPPLDGAANAALIELLASTLGLPKRSIELVSGHSSRHKVVDIWGMDAVQVTRKLEGT